TGANSEKPPAQVPAALHRFKSRAGGFPTCFIYDEKTDQINAEVEGFLVENDIIGLP
ncbi:unnamed protein product, partial [Amoebophrya sp. A120]